MVYWPPYPWYIDPPTHSISTPLPMVYRPPTHGILTPLTMVYRPPYPWYIDPPTHGISTPLTMVYRPPTHGILTPLPMVYQTLSYGIMNSSFGRNEGGFNLPWGVQNTMTKNWPRGQNTIRKIEPGVQFTMGFKIPYDTGNRKRDSMSSLLCITSHQHEWHNVVMCWTKPSSIFTAIRA